MRAPAAFGASFVALASCLIAPPPPNAGTDGGLPLDANPALCLRSNDFAGPAISVDVSGNGIHDTVFRAGITAMNKPVVWTYTTPLVDTRCPASVTLLAQDAFTVSSVDAIALGFVNGNAPHVFVLVSDDAGHASVHDLALTRGGLADGTPISGDPGAPAPVPTTLGTDHPAFVTYLGGATQELWFGGGSALAIALYGSGSPGLAVGGELGSDAWYGAGQVSNAMEVSLVGSLATEDATAMDSGGTLQFAVSSTSNRSIPCGEAGCAGRVARSVYHADATTEPIATMSIAVDSGALEYTDTSGAFVQSIEAMAPDTTHSAADADLADVGGGVTDDLAVLWTSQDLTPDPILSLYLDPKTLSVVPDGSAGCDPSVTRVLAVEASGSDRRLLVLTNHPGQGLEACFTYDGTSTLAPCTP